MKPQTGAFLKKSRVLLNEADVMLEIKLIDAAGRTAYLAGFHAAQALIFERTGKIIKRHRGVRNELHLLIKDDPRFNLELRAFLGRTYDLKTIADYETGPGSEISPKKVQQAVDTAKRFIDCIEGLLKEAA
jgi:uncharacterized protein (UPF0332 family)